MRRALPWIVVALVGLGTWQVASAAWIHAKGAVAQQLIAFAWQAGREHGTVRRPWPGADLKPVARLTAPGRGVELYVLDNASARALAFGPAHVGGTARPASAGNSVIVAHRDTHFAFLQRLAEGDELDVEALAGAHARYRVREVAVVDKHETRVLEPDGAARLTLITCYPFDAVMPGTPWRYVVIADRIA